VRFPLPGGEGQGEGGRASRFVTGEEVNLVRPQPSPLPQERGNGIPRRSEVGARDLCRPTPMSAHTAQRGGAIAKKERRFAAGLTRRLGQSRLQVGAPFQAERGLQSAGNLERRERSACSSAMELPTFLRDESRAPPQRIFAACEESEVLHREVVREAFPCDSPSPAMRHSERRAPHGSTGPDGSRGRRLRRSRRSSGTGLRLSRWPVAGSRRPTW